LFFAAALGGVAAVVAPAKTAAAEPNSQITSYLTLSATMPQ
jgi:hypothetical protein